jgi:plastocyanin
MKSYALPIISSLAVSAYAASHSIDVGEDGLVFSPNSTTAAVGDTVTFHYYPRAHGVARSSYSSPCAAIDNGFNSGFVKVASGESNTTFTITINNTDPIWYYCPQGDHCQAGMVGVINPP